MISISSNHASSGAMANLHQTHKAVWVILPHVCFFQSNIETRVFAVPHFTLHEHTIFRVIPTHYSLVKGIEMQSKIHSLSMKSTYESTNLLMDEMMYEMNRIFNCGYEIKSSKDPRSYERNFSYCVEKPEKLECHTGITRSQDQTPPCRPEFFRLLYAMA